MLFEVLDVIFNEHFEIKNADKIKKTLLHLRCCCLQVEDATQSVNQSVSRVSKGSISGSSGAAAMASGLMTKFLGNGLARFTDR